MQERSRRRFFSRLMFYIKALQQLRVKSRKKRRSYSNLTFAHISPRKCQYKEKYFGCGGRWRCMKATKALYCLLKVNWAHTYRERNAESLLGLTSSQSIFILLLLVTPRGSITRRGVSGKSIKFIALRIQLFAWFYAVLPEEEIFDGITQKKSASVNLVAIPCCGVMRCSNRESECCTRLNVKSNPGKTFFFVNVNSSCDIGMMGGGVKGTERSISGMNDWNVCVDGWHPPSPFWKPGNLKPKHEWWAREAKSAAMFL